MSAINLSGNASGSGTLTITSPNTNSSFSLVLPEEAGTITTSNSPYSTFRNRIINGDMRIDQRNAGASVATSALFPVDRFQLSFSGGGVLTSQRSTTAPAGFTNSLSATASTADASVAAGDFYAIQQRVEGFNAADLGFGTASAKTVTISFWVRASITGTYCVAITNGANARSYVAEYSISAADTWEYKSVTIAGDTSGTWPTDNSAWGRIRFSLGGGTDSQTTAGAWAAGNFYTTSNQANWIGTLNATWYITGVQLEVGSVATPFERLDYGRQLIQCQRYFQALNTSAFTSGIAPSSTFVYLRTLFPVQMRATPTGTVSASGITFGISDDYSAAYTSTSITGWGNDSWLNTMGCRVSLSGFTGLTTGRFYSGDRQTTGFVYVSAEL